MKTITLLVLLFSVTLLQGQSVTSTDFKKLSWLEGTWTRTNSKPGRSGNERWVKKSASEWQGWGVSMSGKDTAFVEKLKLVIKEGGIFYVADVPENKQAVYFKFTELTDNQFTCENPQHDFPKKISYQRNGNKLKAIISGDGKAMEYLFEKK